MVNRIPVLVAYAALSVLACHQHPLQAALIVLDEIGPTTPVPFVIEIERAPQQASQTRMPTHEQITAQSFQSLPVTTDWMTSGRVTASTLAKPISTTPLALIGDDELSLRWLAHHAARLRQAQATIWVISLHAQSALPMIEKTVPGLRLYVASANALKGILPVAHYPLFIHNTQVTQ